MGVAATIVDGLLDLLYPRPCVHCQQRTGTSRGHLCWTCRSAITFITDPFCEQCGDPADGIVEHSYRCSICRRSPPPFSQARSVVRYRGAIQSALQTFKYRNGVYLRYDLAQLLAGGFRAHYVSCHPDVVAPVPLFPRRERTRTYNQAALLAVDLAPHIGIRCTPRLLTRIRDTGTQTSLSASQRRRNVRGAFRVPDPQQVRNRSILLVDDVMTTGHTCREAARTLRAAGASDVLVITVARG